MKSYPPRFIVLVASILVFFLPVISFGQDRDLTSGSSTGSIRPDVLDTGRGSRTRTLSPEKRARFVAEFNAFHGAEKLVDDPTFEALKNNYAIILEGVAKQKGVAADLTPTKFLTFRIMARDLSIQRTGVSADALARAMISAYVKTGDFMPPVLAAEFNKREAKKAESNAVSSLRLFMKQHPIPKSAP
jgi:hypothetical protein